MRALDWLVLVGTLAAIVAYGARKARAVQSADAWLRGGRDLPWWTIGLSIMATQASAITFLSTPGQAYEDGMGFVQFYFGLPVAMVILSALIVPIFYRLKVYTAYEYLEGRFDRKTRLLTAVLFLVQRGLGAGLGIYAPSIIVSQVLGWPLGWTNAAIGALVVVITVSGGTKVVSQTQSWQMAVMLGGMALALVLVVHALPPDVGPAQAVRVAGALGKMNLVDFSPRLDTRYTFWSGMTGGLFVALAYFGTDQSQVQRYLGGASLAESRLGLLMNGLVKIPMQLFILSVGLMVFVFYQWNEPPLFFHRAAAERAHATPAGAELRALEADHASVFARKRAAIDRLVAASRRGDDAAEATAKAEARAADADDRALRAKAKAVIAKAVPGTETKDADYVFITYVTRHLPTGVVGLLIAVILCAAISSTASALNALGSTTVVDLYKTTLRPAASDRHYLVAAKLFTVLWGAIAMAFAAFASLLDNLIQAVNILGSIFYGPTLGVFLVGFFLPRVRGTPVFWALVVAQSAVVAVFALSSIGFLWYNVIGCALVVAVALALDRAVPRPAAT
jgi:Na+/proline symporter